MFKKRDYSHSKPVTIPALYNKLTPSERKLVRETYLINQKNKCWYCNKSINDTAKANVQNSYIDKSLFPKGFFDWPAHLHHDHDTGLTIGTVHARCNAYLWQYEGK